MKTTYRIEIEALPDCTLPGSKMSQVLSWRTQGKHPKTQKMVSAPGIVYTSVGLAWLNAEILAEHLGVRTRLVATSESVLQIFKPKSSCRHKKSPKSR